VKGFDPVIFDLDGTVVDTVELIVVSFRHAVRTVLGTDLPDDVILSGVGRPLLAQMEALSHEHAQELVDAYRQHNHRVHDELIREYEGMEAGGGGRGGPPPPRLAIVTSKGAFATGLAFESIDLHRFFEVVVTADDSDAHKPSPEPILLALERLGAEAEGAIYIGDSPVDVAAGRAAGVATAAVVWGIFSHDDLVAAGPDFVLHSPAEMASLCLSGRPAAG
jgi:pyrophosphatase PpaX